MKKLLVLLLAVILCVTGCSNGVSNESDEGEIDNVSETQITTNESDEESEELPEVGDYSDRVSLSFGKVALPPDGETDVIKAIEERYNIDFDYINFERTNDSDMVALMIASGEVPDVFEIVGNMAEFEQYYKQGIYRSIPEEYLEKYAPTVYETQKEYMKYLKRDGELYGICGERLNNVYPLNAIWRKDWLDAVGIDKLPETLEEAEAAFYAFTNEDPDKNGKNDTYGLGKSGLDMIFGAYGSIPWGPWQQYWLWQENEDGELEYSAVRPGMKEALAVLRKWYEDGVIDPEFVVGENKGGYWAVSTDFVNSKIGFTGLAHFYHWVYPLTDNENDLGGACYKEFTIANPDGELGYGKPVVGPYGDSGTWQYQVGVGAAEVIVVTSDVTDEQLIRYLQILEDIVATEEGSNLVRYGFEGIHWEYNEAGGIVHTEDYSSREQYHAAGIDLVNYINTIDNSKKNNPELYEWGDENYSFPGYRSDLIVSLPSESSIRPDLDLLRDEYYISIITGDKPLDAFDEFVEQWYELGGDVLTDEANSWYDTVK